MKGDLIIVMFSFQFRSLEVNWRSFGGQLVAPNSNLISGIDSAAHNKIENDIAHVFTSKKSS